MLTRELILIALLMAMASIAVARDNPQTFFVNAKQSTKLEAIRALLENPEANVTRCAPVMLTNQATLKIKPSFTAR